MKDTKKRIKSIFNNNKKVVENYFFITILQILNSLFYLLIYPFLIRTLGAESYGLYVFALSIAGYVSVFVSFGFTNPAVREVSLNRENKDKLSEVVSSILTAQTYFFIISIAVLSIIVLSIPFLREYYLLYLICSITSFGSILFPTWFFQGIEQMRFITLIQLVIKLLSLPFIFLFIRTPDDVVLFALINTLSTVAGSAYAMYLIKKKWCVDVRRKSLAMIRPYVKDALPFFWGSSVSTIKMQSTSFFVGAFVSMSSVAMYDLANKLVMSLATALANVNNVLFPKIVKNNDKAYVNKALLLQVVLSISCTLFLIIGGKPIISILGGEQMMGAYPILIILSIIIPCWLIVGAIQLFIIVPMKKYKYITISQTVAFVIYMVITVVGAVYYRDIYLIAVAISVSALAELIYNFIIKKKLSIINN